MAWSAVRQLKTLLTPKPEKRAIYTLDRNAGLVVSRELLVRSKIMDRQLKAAAELYEASQDQKPA